ncbi:MAG TPA: hypothetical protein DEP84_12255 [Chloroflexi bacterium]|nr:hypothetical protein [Chloroflexota bacterium]
MFSTDIQKIAQQHPGYLDAVGENYKWNFVALASDSAIFSFSLGMLSQDTILPYFASQLTDSNLLVGFVPAIYYLGFFFPQLLGAYLVHGRATRKGAIFWIAVSERLGIFCIALLTQSLGFLSNNQALVLLFASYALFSVTNGLIGPAYADFISKNIIRRRGIFYGLTHGLGNLFGFSAGLTAAYLLERYAYPTNLQYLFWFGFATSFVSPFLIASLREVPFPAERNRESLGEFLRNIPMHVRGSPGFLRFIVARAFLGIGIIANAFYALYSLERFDLSEGYLGIFTLIIFLSQSALGLVWGWLGDRVGFKVVFILAASQIAGMGALALTAVGPWAFYLVAIFVGGVYAAIRTADPNMIFELAPPHETSRFVGISNTFVAPVMTLAAVSGGFIADRFSYETLFAIVLVVGLVSVLLMILYMPYPRHNKV